MTLAINKLNGLGLSNSARHERLPKKTKIMRYWLQKYQAIVTSRCISVIKVSGRICSNAFKNRLAFSFTVIISATFCYCLIRTHILEYKAVLKFNR